MASRTAVVASVPLGADLSSMAARALLTTERTLLRMEHVSGVGLLVLALAHGGSIVWQMARHKM